MTAVIEMPSAATPPPPAPVATPTPAPVRVNNKFSLHTQIAMQGKSHRQQRASPPANRSPPQHNNKHTNNAPLSQPKQRPRPASPDLPDDCTCQLLQIHTAREGEHGVPKQVELPFAEIKQRGVIQVYGKENFGSDDCLREDHFRAVLSRKKNALIVDLLASTPAFAWRRGQQIRIQPRKPVELHDGDCFSLLHHCHVLRVRISQNNSQPNLTETTNERAALLNDPELGAEAA